MTLWTVALASTVHGFHMHAVSVIVSASMLSDELMNITAHFVTATSTLDHEHYDPPGANVPPSEHRRRTIQDDYDDEAMNQGRPPHRFDTRRRRNFEMRRRRTVDDMARDGNQYRRALPSFAEPILYLRVARGKRRVKHEDRWGFAIYVGLMERSNEVKVVVNSTGFKVNCIRRLPEAQRQIQS